MQGINWKQLNTFQKKDWVTFIKSKKKGKILDLSAPAVCSEENTCQSLDNESLERFIQALADFSIKTLILSKNKMLDEKVRIIAKGIKGCQSLSTLNLSHNHLGRDGLRSLAINLRQNTTLTCLDISYQHGSYFSNGVIYVNELFHCNLTLTKINFSGNDNSLGIQEGNLDDYIQCFKLNTSLTHLDLSKSESQEIGINKDNLSDYLLCCKLNTFLTHLNLSKSEPEKISTDKSKSVYSSQLAIFLKSLKSLRFLDITGYAFSNTNLSIIVNLVAQHKALMQFNIGFDKMPASFIANLILATRNHQSLLAIKINSEELKVFNMVKKILESNSIISIRLSNLTHTKILKKIIYSKLKKLYNLGRSFKEFEIIFKLFFQEYKINTKQLIDIGSNISRHFYRNDYEKTIFFKGYQFARKIKSSRHRAQIDLDASIKKLNRLKLH